MSPQEISPDSKPVRHPDSVYRAVADEGGLVVLSGRAEVKVLNPVGTKVYSLLDGDHSVADIVREVTEEFEVAESEALEDVRAFIRQLSEHGMLEEPEGKPS